jgi:hypothetical protein
MAGRRRPMKKREFVQFMTTLCAGGTFFGNTIKMMAQDDNRVTRDMVVEAEKLAGIRFNESQRDMLIPMLQSYLKNIQYIRDISIAPETVPSLFFLSDTRSIWTFASKKILEG